MRQGLRRRSDLELPPAECEEPLLILRDQLKSYVHQRFQNRRAHYSSHRQFPDRRITSSQQIPTARREVNPTVRRRINFENPTPSLTARLFKLLAICGKATRFYLQFFHQIVAENIDPRLVAVFERDTHALVSDYCRMYGKEGTP
jgi:hypothetical protein